MNFLAIDFETANRYRHSACAVGMVKVINGEMVSTEAHLIRPPESWFEFTYIHGLTWDDVRYEKTFDKIFPLIELHMDEVDYLVAHNSSFDKSVLRKSCEYYDIEPPQTDFLCTVRLSRDLWGINPTKLPNVCSYFGIPLDHHDALSDTRACAQIMLMASKETKFKQK
jgi:DNA polymerase-3 subunit epsilon